VRLLVISDLNSAYGSTDYEPEVDRAMTLMPYWQPDLVLGGGDMVAGQNRQLSQAQIQAMWAAFDDHVAAPLRQAKLPFGFTVGNHDASSARAGNGNLLFQQDRDLANAYWNDPAHDCGVTFVDRAGFPFYYTFELKDLFFLVWDASSSLIPEDQLTWAEQSLASDRAQAAKLRIVIGHLPLYAVATGRDAPGEVLQNADQKRALLEKYKVHTYISGHDHAYYPAHKGQLHLLNSGLLGSGARSYIGYQLAPRKTLTLIDVNPQAADTVYTTYDMRTLQVIEMGELPRFIAAHNGVTLRRDVEWSSLTPAELATCRSRIGDLCQP
jgi:3',5'-cyclic AMP phosphodiesterase CpdA